MDGTGPTWGLRNVGHRQKFWAPSGARLTFQASAHPPFHSYHRSSIAVHPVASRSAATRPAFLPILSASSGSSRSVE
eukprot:4714243-Pyramimonas_sp.AAC.1